MTDSHNALVHHSIWGTHWIPAGDLEAAITERLPEVQLDVARTPSESATLIEDAEILLSSFAEPSLLDRAKNLEWIQAMSAGVDTLDLDDLRMRDVLLTSAAGAHAQPIAEQTLGYMLTFERRLDDAIEMRRSGSWERFTGGELAGKTLGIVGLGEIGRRTASFADVIGMDVVGTKRDTDIEIPGVDRIHPPDELESVLVESDYLLVACPLTEETRGLIGRIELGVLPDQAVLLNVARGEVVEQDALVSALQWGVIRGAALDVFAQEPLPADSPLWDLSNALLTPHNAGVSPRLPDRTAEIFADNYEAYAAGDLDALRNRVL